MRKITKRQVTSNIKRATKKRSWAAILIAGLSFAIYVAQDSQNTQAASKAEVNQNATISTELQIHDGDTLKLNGIKYRLQGIDAPEIDQTCKDTGGAKYDCGIDSRNALRSLTKDKEIKCTSSGSDRYKREIGTCYVSGVNINSWMVEHGHAIAYRQYSKDYIEQEEKAKIGKVGIWQGNFVEPEKYRKLQRSKKSN